MQEWHTSVRLADLYRFRWGVCRGAPHAAVFQPHCYTWDGISFPLHPKSKIIHGTLSMREKNANHIVLGVFSGASFCVSPSPNSCNRIKFLSPPGDGPSQANYGPKSFYMNLCHAKISLSPISSSPIPWKEPCFVQSLWARPLCWILEASNRKGEKTNTRRKKAGLQRQLQRAGCKTKNKQAS